MLIDFQNLLYDVFTCRMLNKLTGLYLKEEEFLFCLRYGQVVCFCKKEKFFHKSYESFDQLNIIILSY
jgi:hypothetical protein